ncbi:MAG: glutamyl-tRNA reductase [Immundisolibacter sp.]
MQLLALGISHHTAPLDVREQVAIVPERQEAQLRALLRQPDVCEASLWSTCNRTELLVALARPESSSAEDWFRSACAGLRQPIDPYLAIFRGPLAARHMFRLAGGLDSLVVGEPQILGQLKDAHELARRVGGIGKWLGRVYQQAFTVAKRIRTDTAIGRNPVSVAFAAVALARQIFGDLSQHSALIIGAGDTAELTLRHLHGQGMRRLTVANRTRARAQALAARFGAEVVPLSAVPAVLERADIVLSSTNSELPILGKGTLESALKARRRRPMFLVDLAVPRDIEPEVASLSDVYLYTVDDLRDVVAEGLKSRQAALSEAERIVDAQMDAFIEWCNAQEAVPLVRALRGGMLRTRDQVTERALAELRRGRPAEQVLRRLAHDLTNKLAHGPSVRIRRAGEQGDAALLEAARRLLDLDDPA